MHDAVEMIRLLILCLPSWLLPERYIKPFCRMLGWLEYQANNVNIPTNERFEVALAGIGLNRIQLALQSAANQYELRLQILRSYRPNGWSPRICMEGAGILDDALEKGRGAVLWVSHFVFHGLVFEIGMKRAGYELVHVSRIEHGFSKTAFGILFLNPVRSRIEDQYLKRRLMINRMARIHFAKELRNHLRNNDPVSFTVGFWEGRQSLAVSVLGHQYDVATGPITAARNSGAPIIPVFPVWDTEREHFRIVLERPLSLDTEIPKHDMLQSIAGQYALHLEGYISRYPDQWRGWHYLYS